MFSSAVWRLLCKSGFLPRIVQSRHSVFFVIVGVNKFVTERLDPHDINWDSATCLTHSTDKDQRLTLESWFTNLQPNPLNRSRKLPAAYERLLQSEYRTADKNVD